MRVCVCVLFIFWVCVPLLRGGWVVWRLPNPRHYATSTQCSSDSATTRKSMGNKYVYYVPMLLERNATRRMPLPHTLARTQHSASKSLKFMAKKSIQIYMIFFSLSRCLLFICFLDLFLYLFEPPDFLLMILYCVLFAVLIFHFWAAIFLLYNKNYCIFYLLILSTGIFWDLFAAETRLGRAKFD